VREAPDEKIPPLGLTPMRPQTLLLTLLAPTLLFAVGLSVAEKKAVRREMIEMDIAVRNLTSIIATSEKKMLEDSLERLITWQIKDHPEHGKNFRSVLGRWEGKGALKYGKQIQTEANAMRSYTAGRSKFTTDDWTRINNGLTKILTACQGCHDLTRKDNNP
jgi:cytochrome c553